ncbi:hypothetical protein ELI38_00840 [Rhizobium leguminosarum]|uniref:hypothetical protein n=2 Tax=Rhizobium leguminosarum TaxID=384 RepID=UPI001032627C|nr:hypothetical protein [Rhizobium leguminosarum]TAU94646.1 hypothetical protein ELI38_00840 [Rhizobium leguminosarum]TAV09107.1 hypothetical protein ELI37_00475 [Rhizobium leguminosarum]TAW50023.1 hypothetical protein ELI14_00845 [Rhizobium leguminosarum]TAX48895.1 hypothetical protein ELH99_00925 [Rhizobium leguminosarum]
MTIRQPASGRAATRPEALVSYIPVIQEGARRADEGAGETGLFNNAYANFDRAGIVSTVFSATAVGGAE